MQGKRDFEWLYLKPSSLDTTPSSVAVVAGVLFSASGFSVYFLAGFVCLSGWSQVDRVEVIGRRRCCADSKFISVEDL